MISPLEQQILEAVRLLTPQQQQRVLELARDLSGSPPGERATNVIRHAHELQFPVHELDKIQQAIEEDLEQVDWDEWN